MFDHFKTSMLWWLYCMLVREAAPTVQGKVETRPDFPRAPRQEVSSSADGGGMVWTCASQKYRDTVGRKG